MNVQTTLTNNGQVLGQADLIYQNDLKLNPTSVPPQVLTQIIQPQLSQLEITGVSRSGQSIPSQKESNRFRIVKTDAERKSESIDENNQVVQNQGQLNELTGFNQSQAIPTKAFLNDVNSIQPHTANSYQRGRWIVSDYSTESISQTNQKVSTLNQALINGTSNAPITITSQTLPIQQTQIKNEETNNYTNGYIASNQTPSVNSIDHNKIVQNINPSLVQNPVLNPATLVTAQNQAQLAQNATSYYIQNQQVYQQPAQQQQPPQPQSQQQPTQSYQIINQTPSSIGPGTILNQPTQIIQSQVNPTISTQSPSIVANNNFVTGVSQMAPINQTQTQSSQINNLSSNLINQANQNIVTNILPNTVSNQVHQSDNNTQSYKPQNQQNFPNSQSNSVNNNNTLPNQALKMPSQTIETLTIGTSSNAQILNSQIPTQQTSPKDQNIVKAQTSSLLVTNIPENNQSSDSDSQSNDQTTNESKKSDGGIHDRIAEAMDMVKSHLTQAVRDEIVTLKNQIKQLKEYCSRLEQENSVLKKNMPNDTLRQLENLGYITVNNNSNNNNNSNSNNLVTISKNTTVNNLNLNDLEPRNSHDTMISSFTEHLVNKDDVLNNIQQVSNLIPKINGNLLQEQKNLVENYNQLSKNDS